MWGNSKWWGYRKVRERSWRSFTLSWHCEIYLDNNAKEGKRGNRDACIMLMKTMPGRFAFQNKYLSISAVKSRIYMPKR